MWFQSLICVILLYETNMCVGLREHRHLQDVVATWRCPEIAQQPAVECSCDMPHTLRCNGDRPEAIKIIGRKLRSLEPTASVSLLDCTVQNVSALPGPLFEGVALHGLVVSSGEIRDIHKHAFVGLARPLQALGLPNNQLANVPTAALTALPTLDRLDLSHNLLKKLDNTSFKGLGNLSFLDLSDNKIAEITKDAFLSLPQLRTLRLRGNGLTTATVTTLRPLWGIYDLDLSSNALRGPLGPHTLPQSMPTLRILQLSHNMLTSLKKGALKGFPNLTSLMLQHNQIDVLEDHAFEELGSLTQLDMSHNRIVAVSGASLAHLDHLIELSLEHNFLRAVTADLILPLKRLEQLKLDDNDISIIASDAFHLGVILKKFSLSDNPLNCDCSLVEFATWLYNSSLAKGDKSTVVCTTPPSLENALLYEIPLGDLHCGEDEHEPMMAPPNTRFARLPVSDVEAKFHRLYYDGNRTVLEWYIDDTANPYTCDKIFIFEDQKTVEAEIASHTVSCNSMRMENPSLLNITIENNVNISYSHKYRFCVSLFEYGGQKVFLILGCSEIIALEHSVVSTVETFHDTTQIVGVHVDFTLGNIIVNVQLLGSRACTLNIAVFKQDGLISQYPVSCSESHYRFSGLDDGPYEVCASIISDFDEINHPFCVMARQRSSWALRNTNVLLVIVCVVLSLTLIALICAFRRLLAKPTPPTHQYCPPPDVEGQQQHSRYVKLQATTKL